MKLLFRIPPERLIETYRRIKNILQRNDHVIFEALARVTAGRSRPFESPASPVEFAEKHQEAEKILRSVGVLSGRDVALNLMEEILRFVTDNDGVPGVATQALLDGMTFETNQDVSIRLSAEFRWMAEWKVCLSSDPNEIHKVFLDTYDLIWGECVPTYVVQYIGSAITSYKNGMNATAVALLSIATEATLRDVLQTKGYKFVPGGSSVDVYEHTKAELKVVGSEYVLSFQQPVPKPIADFGASTGGANCAELKIRRVIVPRKPGRVDLNIILPTAIVDHLASATVAEPAQKKVNGLGEAFDIARNKERFLGPKDLPLDLDEVILQVRNNLIHLSGEALNTQIPAILDPNLQGVPITLGGFLDNPEMVFDLIQSVPSFINQQYIGLRKSGFLI